MSSEVVSFLKLRNRVISFTKKSDCICAFTYILCL